MQDAWRAYLEMALGLTEAPRKRAQKVAGELVNRGGATAAQLQGLVEDLMSTGMANREALTNIVRYEVDRALGVVGLATSDEVHDLNARVRDLEKQLKAAQARASAAEGGAIENTAGERLNKPAPLPAKKVAKKAPPNQMPAAATAPAPGPAKKAGAAPGPAKKAGAAPGPAKKAVAKKAVKKTVAKSSPPAPVGTAESPVAAIKEVAAATELPPTKKATAAKKAAPVKKAAAKKAAPAKKTAAAKKTAPEAGQ